MPTETTFGVQTRYDDINLGLTDTVQRQFLANVRTDDVKEGSVGVYAENIAALDELVAHDRRLARRSVHGERQFDFQSRNSGNAKMAIGSPKFSMVFGPFYKTEFYLSAGMGFHSNDARGATITEEPTDPSTKLNASPFLVRTKGAEVGVRTKIAPGLNSSVSVFVLDQASEILFSGDAGDTEPSRPSERYRRRMDQRLPAGIVARHRRRSCIDAGSFCRRLRYRAGGDLPIACRLSAGADRQCAGQLYSRRAEHDRIRRYHGSAKKPDGSARLNLRYLGPRPLTEDDAFVSPATTLLNGRIGYRWDNGWRIQLDAFNMTDSHTDQISYAYGSLIKTDSLFAMCFPASGAPTAPAAVCQNGVMDRVLHPVEPLAFRLTLAAMF